MWWIFKKGGEDGVPYEILEWSMAEARRQVSENYVTRDAITESYMDRILAKNREINAYTTQGMGRERSEERGLMAGTTVAVQDVFDVAGLTTTAGSRFLNYVAGCDARVVSHLRYHGAVLLGKTNTDEFAMGETAVNPYHGPTRNPWDIERRAGGSSGGSAAAVAAKMALVGLGTDTQGSVRISSAFCGIVGFKGSWGRVSMDGVIPVSWSLDHVGPVARTVEDTAGVYRIMVGGRMSFRETLVRSRIRVGVLRKPTSFTWDEAVDRTFHEVVGWFADAGFSITEVQLPLWSESVAASFVIAQVEASAYHESWVQDAAGQYSRDVSQMIEYGHEVRGVEYVKSSRIRTLVMDGYRRLFRDVDVLVLPTVPFLAPLLEESYDRMHLVSLTAPFNLAGIPALTVPVLSPLAGLPVGLQLAAHWGGEERLFSVGQWLEERRGPWMLPE